MKITIVMEPEEHIECNSPRVELTQSGVISMSELARLFSQAANAGGWVCEVCELSTSINSFSSEDL